MLKPFLKKNWLIIFFLFLFVFISISIVIINLGFTKNFIGEDSGVVFDFPSTLSKLTYYMWDSYTAPGKLNVSSTFNFIWNNIALFFYSIGLSGFIIKRVLYFSFFFFSGTGMFFLSRFFLNRYLNQNSQTVLCGSFIAGLIYMLNPYTMQLGSIPIFNYHSSYIIFPWIFLIFLYNLYKKPGLVSIILFSLISFLVISANPSNTLIIAFFLLCYFLFFIHDYMHNWKRLAVFFIISFLFIFSLSSYIILPVLTAGTNLYGTGKLQASDFWGPLYLHSFITNFFNLLRLAGSREWPTFSYYLMYNKGVFLFLSFLVPIAAVASFLFKAAKKEKTFFLIMALLFLFAAKGVHKPLPQPMLFLIEKYPVLGIFRAVYLKFIYAVILSFSILIGFTVTEILGNRIIQKFSWVFFLFVALLVFINNFPFFTGLVTKKQYLTNIPNSYQKLPVFFEDRAEGKVLSLPETPRGAGPIMKWGGDYYVGPPTDMFFTNKPTLDGYWFISQGFQNISDLDSWDQIALSNQAHELVKHAGILNLKYILVHKDFAEEYQFTTSTGNVLLNGPLKTKVITEQLQTVSNLSLLYSTGNYDIYEIRAPASWGRIYIPQQLEFSTDQINNLFYGNHPSNQTYAILTSSDNQGFRLKQTTTNPQLAYAEINPTSYQVSVSGVSQPFLLVFSESYHPQWKLKLANGSYISETNHLKVNGYANAWIVPNGTKFTIEFIPQKAFMIGIAISLSALTGCLIIVVFKLKALMR